MIADDFGLLPIHKAVSSYSGPEKIDASRDNKVCLSFFILLYPTVFILFFLLFLLLFLFPFFYFFCVLFIGASCCNYLIALNYLFCIVL